MAEHNESQEQAIYRTMYGGIYPTPPDMPPIREKDISTVAVPGTDVDWIKKVNAPNPEK